MSKIRISPEALNDLKEIKKYIEEELMNPAAANRVVKRIVEDYGRLEVSPYFGPSLSSKINIDSDFRFLVSGNYIVFYKVNEEYISIYRVLYGRRDYLRIIFDDMILSSEE